MYACRLLKLRLLVVMTALNALLLIPTGPALAALDAATLTWEVADVPESLGNLKAPTSISRDAASTGGFLVADAYNLRVLRLVNKQWSFFSDMLLEGRPLYAANTSDGFFLIATNFDTIGSFTEAGDDVGLFEGTDTIHGLYSVSSTEIYSVTTNLSSTRCNVIKFMTPDLGTLTNYTLSLRPSALTVSPQGLLYFATAGPVYAYKNNDADQSLELVGQWGSSGKSVGQFGTPAGIAVDDSGNIYVADTLNNRVQVYDAAAGTWTASGSVGSDPGQFNNPQGIAVDASGNIYVADTGNNRVQIGRFASAAPTASLTGVPSSPTRTRTASITVGGTNVTQYKYSLDGTDWSAAVDVATPITLSSLAVGSHSLSVVGGTSGGVWQAASAATTVAWTVQAPAVAPVGLLLSE
ncbi:NHL repeat-containing protein [Solidesulfovibrio alcoholivorans]|uniref:NHL repeat-containing protein n=1 Tax=Solidesulfovibrio alcoholivorans TaxID=81406 RepID=UPI00069407E4|nr:SMP-30/gluconolactonase/LRE family protein [Solidesulfovibrio alcoholivorans]